MREILFRGKRKDLFDKLDAEFHFDDGSIADTDVRRAGEDG